jgi:periplasmic divalent cation tolerance protein
MKYIIITTATNSKEYARKIASGLVENKLAASVNISQIESFYTWQNKQENANEYLVSIKTKKKLYKKVAAYIKNNHSYELPETVVIPIKNGTKAFLNWINENTL